MIAVDYTGHRFGRLTVLSEAPSIPRPGTRRRIRLVDCRCDCGKVKVVHLANLRSGASTSCGCYIAEVTRRRATTHGDTPITGHAKEYGIWCSMLSRTSNPNCKAYKNYGGRGITVCERWKNSYANFLTDMGRCPSSHHSIERENNDEGYNPENCVWATPSEQGLNTRKTVKVTYEGEVLPLVILAKRLGKDPKLVMPRYYKWKDLERALNEPKHGGSRA